MAEDAKREKPGSVARNKTVRVYDPTSVAVIEKPLDFAQRIDSFDGKRIGLLWNGKPNGNFYLNRVAQLLAEKYKDTDVIKFWELYPEETAHPDQKSDAALDKIAEKYDVVIAAQGD
jgi:hypothetical protein